MKDQPRDPLGVALENLRKGEKEIRRQGEVSSRLSGQAAHKPGGIRLDGPEWARIMASNDLEHHLMAEQEERQRAVGSALTEATMTRRSSPWRPTAAIHDLMNWDSGSGGDFRALGRSRQFALVAPHEFRAAVTTTNDYPEETWRAPGLEAYPQPPLSLVELISWVPIPFDNAEYMFETIEVGAAAETSEGVAAPEPQVNFEPRTTYVRRIPATRQALDDAAVLEDLLQARLLFMVKSRLQTGMIAGNGSLGAPDPGTHLTGILNAPNVLSVTKAAVGSQPQLDAISAAIEAIQAATMTFYTPNVLLLHPSDALQLRELKDTEGRPVFDPNAPLTPGGLATIITSAAPLGQPLVGATSSLSGFIRGDIYVAVSQ